MHIGIDENNKLLANNFIVQDLLYKDMDENRENILRAVKWVNKSWDSNEFEEKILYTVIAMEFLIANIPDIPLLDRLNRNKIKKYVKTELKIDKDTIENRPMMYIALSYDHRIIDGKEAVGFLKTIKELIENPEDLLLES